MSATKKKNRRQEAGATRKEACLKAGIPGKLGLPLEEESGEGR